MQNVGKKKKSLNQLFSNYAITLCCFCLHDCVIVKVTIVMCELSCFTFLVKFQLYGCK